MKKNKLYDKMIRNKSMMTDLYTFAIVIFAFTFANLLELNSKSVISMLFRNQSSI